MNSSEQFVEYVMEQLAPLKGVRSGRFFGGIGLAADGVQFAMVMRGCLYFVVDDTTRSRYEQWGSRCFWYETKRRRVDVKKYFEVPASFIEEQDRLLPLAKESIRIAASLKKTSSRS